MPKVIHVVRKFEPSAWGGVETHLVGLLPELARSSGGWTSEVHAPQEPGTDGRVFSELGVPFRGFRARYPYLGLTPERREALVACGGNLVAPGELLALTQRRDVDLLHVHTLGRLGGVVRLAARFLGIPYAVTLHGPVRANAGIVEASARARTDGLLDFGQPFGWAVGARRVVQDAALVFVLHEGEREAWRADRAGRHLERVSHGVSPATAKPEDRARARQAIPGLGNAPFVLVLGRMEPAKGQDLALAAFLRARPETHLVLAGGVADAGFVATLRQTIAERASPQLHLVGGVAPDLARALLAEAALVVVPSRAEPFGIVLLEAWAEGACTLFHDIDGLGAIADRLGARVGRITPNDPGALAQAIDQSLRDPAALRDEARRMQREVGRHASWASVAEHLGHRYQLAVSKGCLHDLPASA
jgi:alpha-maltose-1-phosphate synthase